MATRLYFSDAVASEVNPGFGGWGENSEAVRRKLLAAKNAGEALNLGTRIGWVAGVTQLDRQYVSHQMNSGISFSAVTVKMQLAVREFNAGDNSTSRLLVKIVSEDGSIIRQTLLALGQFGPAIEFINNATLRNKTYADGDTVAGTYTTVAGDRLVIEIGYTDTGATPEGQARYGAPSGTADHLENETETTSLVPWIEFSNTITFQATQVTKTFTADVIVKDTDVTKTFTADLIAKLQAEKTVTSDLIVKDTDIIKTFTQDLFIKQLDIQKTLTSDLLARLQGTKEFSADLITEAAAPPVLPPSDILLGGGERVPRKIKKRKKWEFEITLKYYTVKRKHGDKKSVTVSIDPEKSKDIKLVQERAVEILLEYKRQVDVELDLANIVEIEFERN